MVSAGGRPFLEYIIRHLSAQGFLRFLILVGYLGERVEEYFRDGKAYGVDIEYSREPRPLGTGGAIRNSLERLERQFLLLYGDSYLPIDYRTVTATFRRFSPLGLMVAYDNGVADTGVANNVAVDCEGWVTKYEKGTGAQDLAYVEAGVLCFCREVFEGLQPARAASLEYEVFPKLIGRRQLRGFITHQRFFDIGTRERLEEFVSAWS